MELVQSLEFLLCRFRNSRDSLSCQPPTLKSQAVTRSTTSSGIVRLCDVRCGEWWYRPDHVNSHSPVSVIGAIFAITLPKKSVAIYQRDKHCVITLRLLTGRCEVPVTYQFRSSFHFLPLPSLPSVHSTCIRVL